MVKSSMKTKYYLLLHSYSIVMQFISVNRGLGFCNARQRGGFKYLHCPSAQVLKIVMFLPIILILELCIIFTLAVLQAVCDFTSRLNLTGLRKETFPLHPSQDVQSQ